MLADSYTVSEPADQHISTGPPFRPVEIFCDDGRWVGATLHHWMRYGREWHCLLLWYSEDNLRGRHAWFVFSHAAIRAVEDEYWSERADDVAHFWPLPRTAENAPAHQ